MQRYVTIDIGGTMLKYGIIDSNDLFIETNEIPTEAYLGGNSILDKVKKIITEYREKYELSGICVSTAGMVDPVKGEIIYSGPAIPNYIGTRIKEELEDLYRIPCEVENDVNCAGLAEVISGSAKNSPQTLCLTVGTGIGGCFILDKDIYHGHTNSACEVGYLKVGTDAFQEVASTTTLVKRVAKAHAEPEVNWNGRKIFEKALSGDEICITEIDRMLDYLAQGIATICYVLNPQTVVLGGGIMSQEDYLKNRLDKALSRHLLPHLKNKLELTFAKHKNNAGMLGAYYNFKNKRLEGSSNL